ncbi:MAG: DUF4011 domain-containing protein [Micrococcus sp.]|nr:DUF4011 domain-containing protein [Micrococcus sp.]
MTDQDFPRMARARAAAQPNQDEREDPAAWVASLGSGAESDTLLRFAPSERNSIDVTHASSSGLSQLMLGRRTRLSTLLTDEAQREHAGHVSLALRATVRELAEERGIDVGALGVGMLSWVALEDGRRERRSAPLLLAPVTLTTRRGARGRDEMEVQITERASLNPALVRNLQRHHGITLDPEQYQQAAYVTARMEPHRALALFQEQAGELHDLQVAERLLISTYADLGDTARLPEDLTSRPVVQALYEVGTGMVPRPPALQETTLPPRGQRHPDDERAVLELDASQQRVVDHAVQGESLVVHTAPGTGQTQTAVALAAQLAWEGRRTLIVAERHGALRDVHERLDAVGLRSLALDVPARPSSDALREQMVRALLRAERATDPGVESVHADLIETRRRLTEHVQSLHHVRPRWGCSPYQAMQALAALTGLDTPPSTTVRLKRSVLDSTVNREAVGEKLHRAGELGAFSAVSTQSQWFGARVRNVQETEAAAELVEEIAAHVRTVQAAARTAAGQALLRPATTSAEASAQAALFTQVRSSLTTFEPEVYRQDVPAMVAATASSAWRRASMVEMSSVTRSRLRRAAKDVVRPGVHPEDLHTELTAVDSQRAAWLRWSGPDAGRSAAGSRSLSDAGRSGERASAVNVVVPENTDALSVAAAELEDRLRRLEAILAPERTAQASLREIDLDELAALVDSLVTDRPTLESLPERTLVLDELREHGLQEILEDLHRREVPTEALRGELELAWWQSALEAMISGDDFLAMMDGAALTELERRFRAADRAALDGAGARLRAHLAQRWREAYRTARADAAVLRHLLTQGTPTASALMSLDPVLTQPLVPILTTSPMALTQFPDDFAVDTVIVLEADTLALATGLDALTRAPHVVAFGDPVLGRPQPFDVSVDPTATVRALRPLVSTLTSLEQVLPSIALRTMHRGLERGLVKLLSAAAYDHAVDALPHAGELTGRDRPVVAHYLEDGTGIPLTGSDAVISTHADVQKTVELVFEHIQHRPDASLAVITVSEQHARKVAAAVQATAEKAPWALEFLRRGRGEDDHRESFVIAPVTKAAGLVRDEVILAPGYGRTPHGRVVHHFGAFSDPDGVRMVTLAFTRARHRLQLVSALRPSDLDAERLADGALEFYRILQWCFDPEGPSAGVGMPSPLMQDLQQRLRETGVTVFPSFAGAMELGIHAPRAKTGQRGARPMALATDGAEAYTSTSVRDRSRVLPEQLEARGWDTATVWTIDVFADPETVAERFSTALGINTQESLHWDDDESAKSSEAGGPRGGGHEGRA